MSSTSHPARVSGTVASTSSSGAAARADEDASEESGLRRSSRIASKFHSTLLQKTKNQKTQKTQKNKNQKTKFSKKPKETPTLDSTVADSVTSSLPLVTSAVSVTRLKRRVEEEEEEGVSQRQKEEKSGKRTKVLSRAVKKEKTVVPKGTISRRMGGALHKTESAHLSSSSSSSSSDEDDNQPTTSKETHSKPPTSKPDKEKTSAEKTNKEKTNKEKTTAGKKSIKTKTTDGDTIAQRVRRSHVDRRNPPPPPPPQPPQPPQTPQTDTPLVKGTKKGKGKGKTEGAVPLAPPPLPPLPPPPPLSAQMSQNSSNRTSASDAAGLASNIFTALGDLEALTGDEFDVNRLQALLEARGLPASLFSNLGPRFQQMLGRIGGQAGGSTQCYNKSMQLLGSLKSSDASAQLAAAAELSQMLVMGNEDTLHGFPIKQAVAALTSVISGEGNFELVNQAVRALSNMMDSLPRSSAVVTSAIPAFLEKLQSIEYMDVAEQSLVALEMLSRRHAKQILRANGVQAVLNYIEFFGTPAQRNALLITASCCSNLTQEEFEYVQPVLPLLSQRIMLENDRKCVEHTCVAFSRIVEGFRGEGDRLREVASHGLLVNVQVLLMATPSVFGSQTFIMVVQMLMYVCTACPDLAAYLLQNKVTETLCFLLTGSVTVGQHVELSKSARSPQEGFELIRLITSLLPDLPTDGIFAVDDLLKKVTGVSDQMVSWFWKDDNNAWIPYTNAEAGIIENAFRTQQEDVLIDTPQAQYVIDLAAFQQINEDTGTSREVRRQEVPSLKKETRSDQPPTPQSDNPNVAAFIGSIFGVLYEVYCTSAGAAIKHKCSEALLKMTYHASPELLTTVMQNLPISSNIASNLATSDVKSVIYALQLADLLMQKLPNTFTVHFRREGVVYQMNLCAKGESVIFKQHEVAVEHDEVLPPPVEIPPTSLTVTHTASSTSQGSVDSSTAVGAVGGVGVGGGSGRGAIPRRHSNRHQSSSVASSGTPRQRRQPTEKNSGESSSTGRQSGSSSSSVFSTATAMATNIEPGSSILSPPSHSILSPPSHAVLTTATPMSRMAMRIASEGRAMYDRLSASLSTSSATSSMGSSISSPIPGQALGGARTATSQACRAMATEWIKKQAGKFLTNYFPQLSSSQSGSSGSLGSSGSSGSLSVLISAVEKLKTEKELSALKEMKQVVLEGNASPFEVIHSRMIGTLLKYLTEQEWGEEFETGNVLVVKRLKRKAKYETTGTPRRLRLMRFMNVFFDSPSEEEIETNFVNIFDISDKIDSVPAFRALVSKLNSCVNQLEQFPVRLTDLTSTEMGVASGRHPIMRVFAQSQLKCILSRHPECPNIRQWRGGMVRVEPLAPIYTIERYLVTRGCGKSVGLEENALDTDEVSDEDELDAMSMAADAARANGRYRLELLFNNNVLPYNWSLYQCIRHFARLPNGDEAEGDSDFGTGQMTLFTNTHTIHYRLAGEENTNHGTTSTTTTGNTTTGTSGSGGSGGSGGVSVERGESHDVTRSVLETGMIPPVESTLEGHLTHKVPDFVTVTDPSLEVLTLLRVLFGLNYHWSEVYQPQAKLMPHLTDLDFINSKLVTKMNRQLQDPMMILTGQIPFWMAQISVFAPFLFPFESRLQLFYVTAFDRDRAMQRLLDANPDLALRNTTQGGGGGGGSGGESFLPRIERRKRTVSRKNLLVQTQNIMDEYAHCRQFLEIQYQDEVGTGLGPTLEFYSLVSKEFQRCDLGLWHDVSTHRTTGVYVHAPCGLFPKPLGKTTPKTRMMEVEGKFRLLGKFMAKSVMDSRMTDITFSPVFYKWLLGQETQLGLADLAMVDPEIFKHVEKLHRIARRKRWLEKTDEAGDRKRFGVDDDLLYDGTKVEDLCLTHLLPGYDDVELCKNGQDKMVTLENLENYVNMVTYFYLREGVQRQMEAFREAFNSVIALKYIQIFRPDEMDAVFCGHGEHIEEGWDVKTLCETCHPDHGFSMESQAVKWLFAIMSKYTSQERRNFIQFVTGSPKLPVGGFKALNPPFTVVKKTVDREAQNIDDYLPSVMTCVNYLKLPDYSSQETMRKKLDIACKEGQHSFHLS